MKEGNNACSTDGGDSCCSNYAKMSVVVDPVRCNNELKRRIWGYDGTDCWISHHLLKHLQNFADANSST